MQIVDISSLVMFHIGWAYTDDHLTQHFESILVMMCENVWQFGKEFDR